MDHQEYIKAIEHEQTLIRRLFTSREKRAEAIEKITSERYAHLVGRFFRNKYDPHLVCRINEVAVRANNEMFDKVEVVLCCSYFCTKTTGSKGEQIVGLYIYNEKFTMDLYVDIDEHLAGQFVNKEMALEIFNKITGQLKQNFGL